MPSDGPPAVPPAGPQAVLFDLDGTLVDTEPHWWRATGAVARVLGVELGPADEPHVLGRTAEDTAAHLLSRASGPFTSSLEGTPGGAAVARDLIAGYARRLRRGVEVMPGALTLLGELAAARIPTALVTASPRGVVALVLPRLGHPFDQVIAAGDTPRGKPYPDPYLEAARRLGADPRRCVAVEDSPAGIAAATAAGCRVLAVTPEHGLPSLSQIRA